MSQTERDGRDVPRYLLGLDGGQTSTDVLLARADGLILGQGSGGPIDHWTPAGQEVTRRSIREAVLAAYVSAGLDPGMSAVAVLGVTGTRPCSQQEQDVAEIIAEIVHLDLVRVVPDYVTNLAGAAAGGDGVVVSAGGGAVAYGSIHGREALASGWGHVLGDEGGAYDIGRQAAVAAVRAADGRGESTALAPLVFEHFGVTDPQDLKSIVYAPDFSRERLAALTPLVAQVACSGDAVAGGIIEGAAQELARAALAVVQRLAAPGEAVAVYPTGGVFRAPIIHRHFRASLRALYAPAEVRPPAHTPVEGALILARRLLVSSGG